MPFSAIKPALYCFRWQTKQQGKKQQSQWKISFFYLTSFKNTHIICTRKLIRIIRKKTLITLINSFINFSVNKNKSKAVHPITKPFSLCVCVCLRVWLCVCRCVFSCWTNDKKHFTICLENNRICCWWLCVFIRSINGLRRRWRRRFPFRKLNKMRVSFSYAYNRYYTYAVSSANQWTVIAGWVVARRRYKWCRQWHRMKWRKH